MKPTQQTTVQIVYYNHSASVASELLGFSHSVVAATFCKANRSALAFKRSARVCLLVDSSVSICREIAFGQVVICNHFASSRDSVLLQQKLDPVSTWFFLRSGQLASIVDPGIDHTTSQLYAAARVCCSDQTKTLTVATTHSPRRPHHHRVPAQHQSFTTTARDLQRDETHRTVKDLTNHPPTTTASSLTHPLPALPSTTPNTTPITRKPIPHPLLRRAVSSPVPIPATYPQHCAMRPSMPTPSSPSSSSPRTGGRSGSGVKASRKVPPIDATTGMDPNLERDDKYEIKSGKLLLLHKLGPRACWLPVHVRVYRNAFEHFAVVSKDQAISANSTYVNLRTATCYSSSEEGSGSDSVHGGRFKVVQNNYEGTVIQFDAGDSVEVREWVETFTCATPPGSPTQQGGMSPTLSPAIPRSPVMPTLPELEEEE